MVGTRNNPSKPTAIGALISKTRQDAGLSINELARRSDIDPAVVFRIESGEIARPTADKVARLARTLHLPEADTMAVAGHGLPSLRPYLRAKYGDLPLQAMDRLERYFDRIQRQYGGTGSGPSAGEDEEPE